MNVRDIALTILFIVVGGAIGWIYCLLVRYSVEQVGNEGIRVSKLLALMLVRVLLVAGGFIAAACFGIWPVVGNIVGFFAVRTIVVSRSRIKEMAAAETKKMKQQEG